MISKHLGPCPNCGGKGKKLKHYPDETNKILNTQWETCSPCYGTGKPVVVEYEEIKVAMELRQVNREAKD